MKHFLKRVFVIIITFVLAFAISVPCLASDTSHGGGGKWHNNMSYEDKVDWYRFKSITFLNQLLGLDEKTADKFAVDIVKPYLDTKGYNSMEEYFADHIGYDEDTDTFVPDDTFIADINICLQQYNDTVTMVYRYPLNKANIDPSEFASKVWYDTFCDLLDAFPDYYFYFNNTTWMQGPGSNINDGSKSYSYYCLFAVKDPFAGVNSYPDLMTTPVYLYNQDWSDVNNVSVILVMSTDNFTTRDNIYYLDRSSFNGNHNGSIYSSLDDFKNAGIVFEDASSNALSMCNQFSWKRGISSFTAYSAKTTPINVYKTVADMKKDIGSQVIGGYTPEYTGKCAPSVSVEVINNIGTDDSGGGSGSGGGSSGSDDSGGGSSILDGLGKVFGEVGKLIDTIFGFILDIFSKLIDNVTKILDMFVGTLKKLVDLVPSGFNEFLAALFPYIPEEWKTIIEAMLLVSVLGIVIAVFRR